MLGSGGDSTPTPPPARSVGPAPLSVDALEAEALASATKAARMAEAPAEAPAEDLLSADVGALGLGFLGITTDDGDLALPLRSAERKDAPEGAPEADPKPEEETKPEEDPKPEEETKPKEDKEAARAANGRSARRRRRRSARRRKPGGGGGGGGG